MIDWAAKWFEVRALLGQSDLATMMYQDQGQSIIKSHFHHREADGFGKIQSLLMSEGIHIQPPIRNLKKPPAIFSFLRLILGLITHPRLPNNYWKTFDSQKKSGLPDEVSALFLSPEENMAIKKMAAQKNLNLGFFILTEIDSLLKKRLFLNAKNPGTWLIPVDLRGAYTNVPASFNFVSFVPVTLGPDGSTRAFEKFKSDLKRGLYWRFWELAQIGRYIGFSGMMWLAKKSSQVGSFWMGSFSDLGVWNQESILHSHAKDRYWMIAPPGSLSYPIGLTTIEWCGNRSITLKLHPGICDISSQTLSEEILNEFRKLIAPAKT